MSKQRKPNKKNKEKYRVKNWSEYNQSLVNRGSLTIWITPEIIDSWRDSRPAQRGAQFEYSDMAIEALLMLKYLFNLPYRATQGLGQSLFKLMAIDLKVPDYSTLSRRAKTVKIDLGHSKQPIKHLILDSTGLKVYGDGEWKVRKHGPSKRRTWRTIHIGLDAETQEIVMVQLTPNSTTDHEVGVEMVQTLPESPDRVTGDGGYDKRVFYQMCIDQEIKEIRVPPQRNAKIWQHGNCKKPPHPRDENLRYIRKHGRKKWKREHGYHQRSLVESGMFRFKNSFGGKLKSRLLETQSQEAICKCAILNRFTSLGLPESYKVINV